MKKLFALLLAVLLTTPVHAAETALLAPQNQVDQPTALDPIREASNQSAVDHQNTLLDLNQAVSIPPFQVSVPTLPTSTPNLTITVAADGSAVVYNGSSYKYGVFNPNDRTVQIQSSTSTGTETLRFSFEEVLQNGQTTYWLRFYDRTSLWNDGTQFMTTNVYDPSAKMIAQSGGTIYPGLSTSLYKRYYSYNSQGAWQGSVGVDKTVQASGASTHSAFYRFEDKTNNTVTSASQYFPNGELFDLVGSLEDLDDVKSRMPYETRSWYSDSTLAPARLLHAIDFVPNEAGEFKTARRVVTKTETFIVRGEADVLSGGGNDLKDLKVLNEQSVQGFRVVYGADKILVNDPVKFGLVFQKQIFAPSSIDQIQTSGVVEPGPVYQTVAVVDYPAQTQVVLNGKTYTIAIDDAGAVQLREHITAKFVIDVQSWYASPDVRLQVSVDDFGAATVTWNGIAGTGTFDPATGRIVADASQGRTDLTRTWTLQLVATGPGAYRISSFEEKAVSDGQTTSVHTFDERGLVVKTVESAIPGANGGYRTQAESVFGYQKIGTKFYRISSVRTGTQSREGEDLFLAGAVQSIWYQTPFPGDTQHVSFVEKEFSTFHPYTGEKISRVFTERRDLRERDTDSDGSITLADAGTPYSRASLTTYLGDRMNIRYTVNPAIDYTTRIRSYGEALMFLASGAQSSALIVFSAPGYNLDNVAYRVDYLKPYGSTITTVTTWKKGESFKRLVKGRIDVMLPAGLENDDIPVPFQTVNGYDMTHGFLIENKPTPTRAFNPVFQGVGLVFSKTTYTYNPFSSVTKTVNVRWPLVKTVTLDGITYRIILNAQGQIVVVP